MKRNLMRLSLGMSALALSVVQVGSSVQGADRRLLAARGWTVKGKRRRGCGHRSGRRPAGAGPASFSEFWRCFGVSSIQLVAIAVIAFGAALLISSNANMRLRILAGASSNADSPIEKLVRDTAADTAGLQTMTGLSAIVLGILALTAFAPTTLVLIALLGLGCLATLSSAFIAGAFARAFHMAPRS